MNGPVDLEALARQKAQRQAQEAGMIFTLASQIYIQKAQISVLKGFDQNAYESNEEIAARCIQAAIDFHTATQKGLSNVAKTRSG